MSVLRRRFIPARAGNTCKPGTYHSVEAVHPRPRGEHPVRAVHLERVNGSSPPARGTQRRYRLVGLGLRFIPARAGNTSA